MGLVKKRELIFDVCKFYAIFSVVLLHFGTYPIIDQIIHSFHMPIFFIISGYFFNLKKDLLGLVKKGLNTLILPYFVFSIFSYLFWSILFLIKKPNLVLSFNKYLFLLFFNNTVSPYYGTIQWFLVCLFFTQIFAYYLNKINNDKMKIIVSILIFFFGIIISDKSITLPFTFNIVLISQLFFMMGVYCKKFNIFSYLTNYLNSNNRLCAIYFIILTIIFVYFAILNGNVNMRTVTLNNPVLFIVNSWLGTLFVYFLSFISIKTIKSKKLLKLILYFGQNTILILLIHRYIDGLFKTFFVEGQINNKNIYMFLFTCLSFFIMYPIIKLINSKLPFLIGRKSS